MKFAPVSERVTYDRRALDALAASDPTLAGILSPHRKVTVVPRGKRASSGVREGRFRDRIHGRNNTEQKTKTQQETA